MGQAERRRAERAQRCASIASVLTTKTPLGSGRTGLDKVQHGHLGAQRRGLLGGGKSTGPAADHNEVVVVAVVALVPVVGHGGDAGRGGPAAGVSRSAVLPAPGQGVVVATDEVLDGGRVGFAGRVGNPREGRRRVAVGPGIGHLLPKAALDEPLTVLGPGGEGVVDHLDLGGEQDGEGAKDGRGPAVETAYQCREEDGRGREHARKMKFELSKELSCKKVSTRCVFELVGHTLPQILDEAIDTEQLLVAGGVHRLHLEPNPQ